MAATRARQPGVAPGVGPNVPKSGGDDINVFKFTLLWFGIPFLVMLTYVLLR